MRKEIAAEALSRALRHSEELNDLARWLKDHLSPEEYAPYRLALARIVGEILLSIIDPIVDQHEDLRPPGLK